jgi:hypothetical protein
MERNASLERLPCISEQEAQPVLSQLARRRHVFTKSFRHHHGLD